MFAFIHLGLTSLLEQMHKPVELKLIENTNHIKKGARQIIPTNVVWQFNL